MRTVTGGESTTLGLTTRTITLRVKVANGSGTMIDYSSYVEHVSIDHDVDQPVGGCTITFTRASGPLASLAPLRTDSTLNVNDVPAYSPALDLNRSVTVEVATTTVGAAIVGGDYKLMFKGTIDVVNFEHSPVSVVCRDLGAPLVDRWIEAEATYGSGGGTAIQTVMQSILDDVFGAAVYTLYVPVSPGFNIITYRQQRMSVMDALQDLVQLIGWDVRFKWDDGTSAFRLTLTEPPRTKTTPDYTFGPSTYFDITELNLDITNIRNVITGSYRNSANLGNRATVTVTDSASITKYGRRFFYLQEADVSPIDTSSEMTTMITAALADMKDPKAEQGVDGPFFWPADISDLYRYSANAVHYNGNQDIAVVEYTHELSRNSHRTRFKVRGTPIGQYATWLGRGGTMGGGAGGQAFPPYPFIVPLNTEGSDATWDLRFNALNGSGGGGTNLTYTIKSKEAFGTEATLVSGNASAFPDDVTITRNPKQDQVITFTVTDAATGLFAADKFTVPAFVPAITGAGNVNADLVTTGSTHRAVPLAELPVGTQSKTMIISSAAFYPESDATDYTSVPDGIEVDTGSGSFIAFAPLPQGVTITKLEMWSKNPSGGGASDVTCRLFRQSASAFGAATQIAIATRTAVASDGGGMDASSTVSELVSTNTYCLELFLGDSLDAFLNAIIYYTMPSYDKSI